MERRRFLGVLTGTSLGVLLKGFFGGSAQAQNSAQATARVHGSEASQFLPNSTIILVHAAWEDGSCWSNIILPLERHGLHVICAPIPLTSLTNDATALSQVLERTSGPVVLVGHAYSGAVIAAVREDRVKSLVYITALAPDEGETVAKVFYLNPNSPEAPKMSPDSHGLIWMPDDGFRPSGCPEGLRRPGKSRGGSATATWGSVHSRNCANANMENEAVMVFGRGRGSHDQSENPAFHGGSDGREGSFVPGRSHSDVLRSPGCYQRDPGGGARDPLTIIRFLW